VQICGGVSEDNLTLTLQRVDFFWIPCSVELMERESNDRPELAAS
jgi:hypothetical protein